MPPTYYTMLAQPTTLDPDAGRVLRETHWSAAEAMRLLADAREHSECAAGLDGTARAVLGMEQAEVDRG